MSGNNFKLALITGASAGVGAATAAEDANRPADGADAVALAGDGRGKMIPTPMTTLSASTLRVTVTEGPYTCSYRISGITDRDKQLN